MTKKDGNGDDFLLRSQWVLEKGFLPLNKEYNPLPHTDQEEVERCPKKYIIAELLEPCYILWSKNIFTYMVSDHYDNYVWIAIKINDLSLENMDYIATLPKKVKFAREEGCIHLGVKNKGEEAKRLLVNIVTGFKMQDVPKSATISYEDAIISCGCFKEKLNPHYLPLEEYQRRFGPLQYGFYSEYLNSIYSERTIKIMDTSKVKGKKDILLKKNHFAPCEGIIYKSPFYLQKHLRYIKYLTTLEEMAKLIKRK